MPTAIATLDLGGERPITIRKVSMERPWVWLRAGLRDLTAQPLASLGYGLIWTLISVALVAVLWFNDHGSWLLPLAAGFMLVGPLVAIGLYQISRDIEEGRPVSFARALGAWRGNATQIGLLGVLLMIFLLAWIRFATLLFALFFGTDIPTVDATSVYSDLLLSTTGLSLIAVGTLIGAVLSFVAFTLSVVSVPHLLADRSSSVLEAVITSIAVVKHNLRVMLLWAFLIGSIGFVGLAPAMLGLIVVLPLLGHASWHAYQDLVGFDVGIHAAKPVTPTTSG
jgi:uncharacterized membrane protein